MYCLKYAITTNFNLFSRNVVTFGLSHKFFTFTLNGLKGIAPNQRNNVELLLFVGIPTSVGNDY